MKRKMAYEAPAFDLEWVEVEEGFAVSGNNPEDWKDSGNNWEQD